MPLRPRDDDRPELDFPELREDEREVEERLLELDFRLLTPDDLDEEGLLETPDDREELLPDEEPELLEYPLEDPDELDRVVARLDDPLVLVVDLGM